MTLKKTPLHEAHALLGAHFTDFGGWDMPLRYSSELEEHRAVREAAGIFDLSHMGEIWVEGPDAAKYLNSTLAGNLAVVAVGRAKYSLLLNEAGGIVDDLISYRLGEEKYLVVPNAGNAAEVFNIMQERAASFDVQLRDATADTALIAVQGPKSAEILAGLMSETDRKVLQEMKYYSAAYGEVAGQRVLIARTGYTGEDGFELYLERANVNNPGASNSGVNSSGVHNSGVHSSGANSSGANSSVVTNADTNSSVVNGSDPNKLWNAILEAGSATGLLPAGLAARDSLRLEAGMPLYGNELGPGVTPAAANLGPVVSFKKEEQFVGREALETATETAKVLVGLKGLGRRAGRSGYAVTVDGKMVGEITSGLPSPTLGYPVALAYVDREHAEVGTAVDVDLRGKPQPFEIVSLPFYKREL
ncbi:MAG TPA: glycine cleavage T C-terminal barrel domain-containing protein [Microbacteriaceae bacterium]|nr:glycine cleavage T C-terminal barrel domain-containing protein [Microbacteriaceae bacterium]